MSYIKTTTHNYVSRGAIIEGAKHVEIKGRSIIHTGVKIYGEETIIKIGRYSEIFPSTVLEPSENPLQKDKYIPMVIGSHTRIGKECKIRAAAIGSMVWIGDGVKIGQRCIIKDNCIIESNAVLGNDTVLPPFSSISNTSTRIQELAPSFPVEVQESSFERYAAFSQEQRKQQLH